MRRLMIAFIMLFSITLLQAQDGRSGWTYSVTVSTAGAGLTGGIIRLSDNVVPVAVWVDTLTTASTIGFDIIFGDTAGYSTSSEQMWRTLSAKDDGSTDWSATLTDDKIIPLDPGIFMSLMGKRAYINQVVWIRPFLSAKQTEVITIYIRVRYI